MFLLIPPYRHTLLSAWAVIAGYEKMKRCAVLRYLRAKVFILCWVYACIKQMVPGIQMQLSCSITE